MKTSLCAAIGTAALFVAASAHAEGSALSPFLGMGLTFGGEELATATFTNGDTQSIRTGGFFDFRAGLEYHLAAQPFALQTAVGYHFDAVNAKNGDMRFARVPVELIGMLDLNNQWRVGVGARKASGAKVTASGDAVFDLGSSTSFKASTGALVQVEYRAGPIGLQARYVNETYTVDNAAKTKFDGNHVGLYGLYYFR